MTVRPLTVITNSLDIATVFADEREVTLVMAGGIWDPSRRHMVGEAALATLAVYRADWAFLGTCAIHPDIGVTVVDPIDAQWKRAVMKIAARRALLADHSKFHQIVPNFVAPLSDFDVLVSDQSDPALASQVNQMLLAQTDSHQPR